MQWRFGASTAQQTGLLALSMPFFCRDLYEHALPDAQRPEAHAIGVNAEGQFRTAEHKEYPAALSAGMANAIAQPLRRSFRDRSDNVTDCPAPPERDWTTEVARASSVIREHATWLPDFQG